VHPDQRALPISLPITELADLDTVYTYSFIVTNLDVSTPDKVAVVEHWYRHRTQVENVSVTPSMVPSPGISRRDIRRSTPRGCGVCCSRSTSRAGGISSPPPPAPAPR
jgi:hypothetical protein